MSLKEHLQETLSELSKTNDSLLFIFLKCFYEFEKRTTVTVIIHFLYKTTEKKWRH